VRVRVCVCEGLDRVQVCDVQRGSQMRTAVLAGCSRLFDRHECEQPWDTLHALAEQTGSAEKTPFVFGLGKVRCSFTHCPGLQTHHVCYFNVLTLPRLCPLQAADLLLFLLLDLPSTARTKPRMTAMDAVRVHSCYAAARMRQRACMAQLSASQNA
jgi:hypothetical protein